MSQMDAKSSRDNSRNVLKVVLAVVVGLLFVGSILLAVFIGGEFAPEANAVSTKGLIRLTDACYDTSYIEGDKFVFDKESSSVMLVAKDMSLGENGQVVKVDDLPAQEYGFKVNGDGDIIYDPAQIIVTKDVHTIDIVSKQYPDVTLPLDITVYGGIDTSKLAQSVTLEAENADLYTSGGELLSQEDKKVLPDTNKPYLSNEGDTKDGLSCSGGACIRNFSVGMKMDFIFASAVSGTYDLTIKCCSRPSATAFDSGVTMTVNGNKQQTGVTVPAGDGYFTPYEFTIQINVVRGLNTISFESIAANCNLDALVITAGEGENVFGDKSAVGEVVNKVEESGLSEENFGYTEEGALEENPAEEGMVSKEEQK